MDKLISMNAFVSDQWNRCTRIEQSKAYAMQNCSKYLEFIKKPLTLGMFLPCNEEMQEFENPLQFETDWFLSVEEQEVYEHEIYLYEKYTEKVLFEVFDINVAKHNIGLNKTIEDLIKYNVFLTESAKKQIGL